MPRDCSLTQYKRMYDTHALLCIHIHRSDAELKEDLEYLHGALEKDSRDLRLVQVLYATYTSLDPSLHTYPLMR